MGQEELIDFIERYREHVRYNFSTKAQEKEIDEIRFLTEMSRTGKNGLNFAKLFLNKDGGYSFEQLNQVLKNIINDIHSGDDLATDFDAELKLREILGARIKRNEGEEGQEEEAQAEDGEDEEKKFKWNRRIVQIAMEEAGTPEEKAIVLELSKYVQEQKDERGSLLDDIEKADEEWLQNYPELQKYIELKEKQNGLQLQDIEDADEFVDAYIEWLKELFPIERIKSKPQGEHILRRVNKKLEEEFPEYKILRDQISSGHEIPRSLVDDEFMPTKEGHLSEMMRIESNLQRYPHGFRHLQSYSAYKKKFPDA